MVFERGCAKLASRYRPGPHLDEHREDGVADDCDGRLHDVGEECGEGKAVRHVASGTVAVHLGNGCLFQWSASKILGIR